MMLNTLVCFTIAKAFEPPTIPDLVTTAEELPDVINRSASIAVAENPQLLPTVDEINSMSQRESSERMHYFASLFILTYLATVLLGTCIMMLGPKCGCVKSDGWQQMAAMQATDDQADTRPAWKINEDREDEIKSRQIPQRWLATVVFSAVFCVSLAAATFSFLTDRLSKRFGVDWEIYFLLFALNCIWLLSQAVAAAARAARASSSFALTAFFEGTVTGTFPLIADAYDTLKDVLVGALCVHSDSMLLKVLGVTSWVYLAAIHFIFLGWFPLVKQMVEGDKYYRREGDFAWESWCIEDVLGMRFLSERMASHFLTEMLASYAPIMVCPTSSKQGPVEDGAGCWSIPLRLSNFLNATMDALSGLAYKQVTPIKRSLLGLENTFQGMVGIAYMVIEGGSIFVAVLNVAIPLLQILLAFLLHETLRRKAAGWFAKKLKLAIENQDPIIEKQVREEAFEEVGIFTAVALHLANYEEFTELKLDFAGHGIGDAGAVELAAALEQLQQLTTLRLGLDDNSIGDAGAMALAGALRCLVRLKEVTVLLSDNTLGDKCKGTWQQLKEELRKRKCTVKIHGNMVMPS